MMLLNTVTDFNYSSSINKTVLFENMTDLANLNEGWKKVQANGGCAGTDNVTLEDFKLDLENNLSKIRHDLVEGTYKPGKLKTVKIKEENKKYRTLKIPTVRDRVLQTSVLLVIQPELNRKMSRSSWAYRTNRSIYDALHVVNQNFEDGYSWVVDVDIRRFFDNVPHKPLVEDLTIWLPDENILLLVSLWLRSFSIWQKGIAQGSPISPLLANLFLHPIDMLMSVSGHRMIRYADDLIIMCQSENQAFSALRTLSHLLWRRKLYLNKRKSNIIEPGTPFEFLGQELVSYPE